MRNDDGLHLIIQQIETERLVLRKVMMTDAVDAFQYCSDPEVTRYVTWRTHQNLDDTECFLAAVIESYETTNPAGWGIVLKESGEFIGTIGVDSSWRMKNFRLELGYVLHKKYWRKGLCTEAAKAVIDCLFNFTAVNRIQAHCLSTNIASARLMEKCGMKFEGLLRQYLLYQGEFEDVKAYSILRSEFIAGNR